MQDYESESSGQRPDRSEVEPLMDRKQETKAQKTPTDKIRVGHRHEVSEFSNCLRTCYDDLLQMAEDMQVELNEAYKTSTLPHHVDMQKVDDLCRDVIISFLDWG